MGSREEGRALQGAAVLDDKYLNTRIFTDKEIARLDRLNEQLRAHKQISDEEFPFVVPHFRGINFNRNIFTRPQKHEFVEHACDFGLHSKMSYVNARIPIGKILTNEEEAELKIYDEKIYNLWSKALNQRVPMNRYWVNKNKQKTKRNDEPLEKPKYLLQEKYTDSNNKTYEHGKYVDIWEELWTEITKIKPKCGPEFDDLFDELKLEDSPIISFGKTPGHAVRYAVGRSLSGALRSSRGDPFFRNTGKAKHRLIGLVYMTLHTINDYFSAKPSDVAKLHKKNAISVNFRYLNETEVSFPGGVDKKHIVAAIPIYFPNFESLWEELDEDTQEHYAKWYGLNKEKYNHFANGFKNTVRPEPMKLSLFEQNWQIEYEHKYVLDLEKFTSFKRLLAGINNIEELSESEYIEKAKKLQFKALDKKGKLKTKNQLKKAMEKKLRDINPYRVLKNELRDYFAGFSKGNKFIEGHLSKLLLDEARKQAAKQGKFLVYRDADKEFKPYDDLPHKVKNAIVVNAKKHDITKRSEPQVIVDKTQSGRSFSKSSPATLLKKDLKQKKPQRPLKRQKTAAI